MLLAPAIQLSAARGKVSSCLLLSSRREDVEQALEQAGEGGGRPLLTISGSRTC